MIFLDTSVVLDLILLRKDKKTTENLLQKISQKEDIYAISILTIHLVYYFAKKFREDLNKIKDWLEYLVILDLNYEDYVFVINNLDYNDMEDDLQIACSIRNKCQKVFTSDKKMTKKYKEFVDFETF